MTRWQDEPWSDPAVLCPEMVAFYAEAVAKGHTTSLVDTAVKKLIQHRGWTSVDPQDIARVVQELGIFWIPSGKGPGPGICFPITDLRNFWDWWEMDNPGAPRRFQIRLLGDSEQKFHMKYMSLGDPDLFNGAAWFGNDPDTLEAISATGEVLLVEGPLDLAAIRIAGCPIPSLSPLTKRLGPKHWDFLRVFGLKKISVMFDNELSRIGENAADDLARNQYGIQVKVLTCPAKDPAAALEDGFKLHALQRVLRSLQPDHPDEITEDL